MFKSVKRERKLPEIITAQVRRAILEGSLKPGDKLPSEREMVSQFQASRIVIREALKSLEVSGLVNIKSGVGVFVNELDSKPVSRSLFSLLLFKGVPISELTDARVVLEPNIAKMAAKMIEDEDILRLEKNIQLAEDFHRQKERDASVVSNLNIEFHSLVAEATHNSVIHFTLKTFFDVLKEMTSQAKEVRSKRAEISDRALKYHKQILKALREKNQEKAYELMLLHVVDNQEDYGNIGTKKVRRGQNTFHNQKPVNRGKKIKV